LETEFNIRNTHDGRIFITKYDPKHGKLNICGEITKDFQGEQVYVTKHRDLLRKYQSLGVDQDILEYLSDEGIDAIYFVHGKRPPYNIYLSSVDNHLHAGLAVVASNSESLPMHIPVRQMTNIQYNPMQRKLTDYRVPPASHLL